LKTSVGSNTPIIYESHASYEGTSEVDAIVKYDALLDVDAYAHDISESAPELAESSVSS